jgi:hypothetical protein
MVINITRNLRLANKGRQEEIIMAAGTKKRKLLALLGIFIFLLLNPPLMQTFNREASLGGIPALVLYIHLVWILAIAGLYAFSRSSFRE